MKVRELIVELLDRDLDAQIDFEINIGDQKVTIDEIEIESTGRYITYETFILNIDGFVPESDYETLQERVEELERELEELKGA